MDDYEIKALEAFAASLGLTMHELADLIIEYNNRPEPEPVVDAVTIRMKHIPTDENFVIAVMVEDVEQMNPLTSFQMQLLMDAGKDGKSAKFLGIDKTDCLCSKQGWTAACSTKSLRVGGFSSSLTPITESGMLIKLIFDEKDEIELSDFRLSGITGHRKSGFIKTFPELLIFNE